MLNHFCKLQMLSGQQLRWLVQAIFLLPINALAFGLLGLKDWQRVLVWLASAFRTSPGNAGLAGAKQVTAIVELAARSGFFKANCLQRSLTLWWMLKRL
nr:lasso peptide biosynthesis protein [Acidobacteriota bacterium]